MKTYTAIFRRYNPQLRTYITERTIEAENKRKAAAQVRKIENNCIYGSMEFVGWKEEQ